MKGSILSKGEKDRSNVRLQGWREEVEYTEVEESKRWKSGGGKRNLRRERTATSRGGDPELGVGSSAEGEVPAGSFKVGGASRPELLPCESFRKLSSDKRNHPDGEVG